MYLVFCSFQLPDSAEEDSRDEYMLRLNPPMHAHKKQNLSARYLSKSQNSNPPDFLSNDTSYNERDPGKVPPVTSRD